jgi:Tol biopolymer transport system component
MRDAKHWFNHLLFNTDGSRFVFLHRWRVGKSWQTRMLTADPDGKNLRVVDDNGMTSHFIWRDKSHILAWSNRKEHGRKFYLFEDGGKKVEVVGKDAMTEDGHCSYLPGQDWIVCDTYPDKARLQHPYLFQVSTGKKVPLGHFLSPKEYTGEWRCDTHPRFSPDGKSVVIDSPHAGGRQLHLIDVSGVI